MKKLFYKLGKLAGPGVRKAKWVWDTAANSEEDAIKAEHQVGRDMAAKIRSKFGLARDEQTEHLINQVGGRLAERVENKLRRFHFESICSGQREAFCLPGGFVFVSRSMAQFCDWNQDQMAFILAHEMAHVINGHAMERMISNSAIATVSRSVRIRNPIAGLAQKAGVKFLERAYSQRQELKADACGIRLMSDAGYNPESGLQLLKKLQQYDKESELGKYFSTHPGSDRRIRHLRELLDEDNE